MHYIIGWLNLTDTNEIKKEKIGDLPFAYNEIVRLMKKNLDNDKMIKEQVKIEMNKFLGDILVKVCKQLNQYPYSTIDYEMLKECIYPYSNIDRIDAERERIISHLESIKADCDILIADAERTLRKNEGDENPQIPPQSST